MPIYNPVITQLNTKEIKRYAGLAKCQDFSPDLLEHVRKEALLLSQFKGVWQLYDYDNDTGTILSPTPLAIHSEALRNHLSDCSKIVVMAVTIGPAMEIAVQEHFAKGDYTLALLLDAAATAMVETGADLFEDYIKNTAQSRSYRTKWRFSPGYGQWDIRIQPNIVNLAEAATVHISTTESCMLVPRKSVTAVIGWSQEKAAPSTAPCRKTCSICTQKNCLSRN